LRVNVPGCWKNTDDSTAKTLNAKTQSRQVTKKSFFEKTLEHFMRFQHKTRLFFAKNFAPLCLFDPASAFAPQCLYGVRGRVKLFDLFSGESSIAMQK
jgi:hypothetical protein